MPLIIDLNSVWFHLQVIVASVRASASRTVQRVGRGAPPAAAAWHTVADAAGVAEGTTLLDVGCGTGAVCRSAADRGVLVHGADVDPGRIAAARRSIPAGDFRVAYAQRLPWPDDAFDVVTGFNVFQYAPDVEAALSEAARVTR